MLSLQQNCQTEATIYCTTDHNDSEVSTENVPPKMDQLQYDNHIDLIFYLIT